MPERIDLQAAMLAALPAAVMPDDRAGAWWRASLSLQDEDPTEGDAAPAAAPGAPAPLSPQAPEPQAAPVVVEASATTLTLQRQLVLTATPSDTAQTWHVSLPSAWEMLAVRHDTPATGTAPTWTLTLHAPRPLATVPAAPEGAVLAAGLERLQTRLSRLSAPIHARVVLAGAETHGSDRLPLPAAARDEASP